MQTKFIASSYARLAALTAVFAASLFAVEAGREIAPGVYVFQGDRDKREPANATLVLFKEYAFLVDGNFPWGARELLPKIKAVTNKPIRYVVNTHYHGDHSYGNSLYVDSGATIVTSEATALEMRSKGKRGWDNFKDPDRTLEGARFESAGMTYSESMFFDDGTQRIELYRMGPAHSNGDTVVYLPKQGIVVTGDLCVTWAYGNNVGDADADYQGWLKALDRMVALNPKIVVPGHGPVSDVKSLHTQHEYLEDMQKQVQAGIQAGKTADQLSQQIDLRSHGTIASTQSANATSVKAMYSNLTKPK